MNAIARALPAALALAVAAPASAQGLLGGLVLPKTWDQVRIPFMAEPVAPEGMAERTVAAGEPFMQRRLSALKSVTLTAEVSGSASWPKGTRLIYAKGAKGDYYCGAEKAGILAYKVQWGCLRDEDGDGVFDAYHPTPANPGAYLPSFNAVFAPKPIQAPYAPDAEPDFYETAIVKQNTFNIYASSFFYLKVRRSGEPGWNDVASVSRGVGGGYVAVKGGTPLPHRVALGGAVFELVAKTGEGVVVRPRSVETGVMTFGLVGGPRF